ncbi:N-acetylglucosamine kinase [Stigmatella aurantiaca]|uniref:BadF/BadG/BcrA/BcrD ATPase domain protein n=2 Tax=Stigmatella aurantiaca (strain DW4/3-1) TaxID=378806 RepID=E3FTX3_STIAD|nr:BadF/BadG/BcrA/BcrD ATPase family protein [Stigmatella aurantiaca]ADO70925.1 BadF/BadG/BcrA/BcrD ATPase domain protein [Stigmatella aurantiaca DW4/3-1]
MKCDLVVDGGGSTTRLGLAIEGRLLSRLEGPSCNEQTTGGRGMDVLAGLLDRLWRNRPPEFHQVGTACLALSNAGTRQALQETGAALRALAGRGLMPLQAERLWLMNDIVPPVAAGACDVVAICGTGTGYAAMAADGRWARASGMEYLLSDEGGGFDLGRRGLAAVVRMRDGRGPVTSLAEAATAWAGEETGEDGSAEALCTRVHATGAPKLTAASFAPAVLAEAARGDTVAGTLLAEAARELAAGITAVASRCHLTGAVHVGMGGSLLLAQEGLLRRELMAMLSLMGWQWTELPRDPLDTVARLAHRLTREPHRLAKVPLALELNVREALHLGPDTPLEQEARET